MQVCYSEKSLTIRRWSWCVQKWQEGEMLYICNPFAQSKIALNLQQDGARRAAVALTRGVPSERVSALLKEAGLDGEQTYAYLMREGLIE